MATVFARLKVPASEGGLVDHGVHAFLVPIRDEQHRLMPGVDIKDCGYKVSRGAVYSCCVQLVCVQLVCVQLVCAQLIAVSCSSAHFTHPACESSQVGLNGIDNGALRFTHVRIPRDNLLDRFGSVDRSGKYTSPMPSAGKRFAATLGELTGGRVGLVSGSVGVLKVGFVWVFLLLCASSRTPTCTLTCAM